MADVYKNFTHVMDTVNTAIFTVPQADVANNIPVSTFVCKNCFYIKSL